MYSYVPMLLYGEGFTFTFHAKAQSLQSSKGKQNKLRGQRRLRRNQSDFSQRFFLTYKSVISNDVSLCVPMCLSSYVVKDSLLATKAQRITKR